MAVERIEDGWMPLPFCSFIEAAAREPLSAGIVYHKFSVITVPDLARGLGGVASSNSLSDGEPKISPQYSDFKMTGGLWLLVAKKNWVGQEWLSKVVMVGV